MQVIGLRRVPNSLGVLGPLGDEPKGAQLRPLRRSRLPVLLKPLESVRKGRIVRGLVRELADHQRERLGVPKPIPEFPPVTSAVLPLRRCMTLPLPVSRSLASTPFRCPALSRPAAGADVAGQYERFSESLRVASICAFTVASFCSTAAMASAPATKRCGSVSESESVTIAWASFLGSPPCLPCMPFHAETVCLTRSA